jgi:hypothetical protein
MFSYGRGPLMEYITRHQDGTGDGSCLVWSHTCTLDDLVMRYAVDAGAAGCLDTGPGWARRRTARWTVTGADLICPVRDLAGAAAMASVPVRGFTGRARQRHRPGLQYLLATGRMHGFEGLAGRRVLVALDFAGDAGGVLSQPFTLRFTTVDGAGEHTPGFLALLSGTAVLIVVRPARLIKNKDMVKFAAAWPAAAAARWSYAVVAGWRRRVLSGVDALSGRRRPMAGRRRVAARAAGAGRRASAAVRRAGGGDLAACGGPCSCALSAVASPAGGGPGPAAG